MKLQVTIGSIIYFQFLILFLVVFCGFLAENYRDYKVEREIGKQYVVSFREDICKDTAILQTSIQYLMQNINASDSLVKLIEADRIYKQEDIKNVNSLNLSSLRGFSVSLTDRSTPQLKS
jgi:hypothetical protein